jgi:hypothetical protein
MALIVKDNGTDFEPIPAGIQFAVCCGVHDIGIQNGNYGPKHQVVIQWEVDVDGTRRDISKFYNLSLNEKATLRLHLEGWRGKKYTSEEAQEGIDLEALIGKPCAITVQHDNSDGKVRQSVTSVAPLPKGAPALERTITEVPEFIQKKQSEAMPEDVPPPTYSENDAGF